MPYANNYIAYDAIYITFKVRQNQCMLRAVVTFGDKGKGARMRVTVGARLPRKFSPLFFSALLKQN